MTPEQFNEMIDKYKKNQTASYIRNNPERYLGHVLGVRIIGRTYNHEDGYDYLRYGDSEGNIKKEEINNDNISHVVFQNNRGWSTHPLTKEDILLNIVEYEEGKDDSNFEHYEDMGGGKKSKKRRKVSRKSIKMKGGMESDSTMPEFVPPSLLSHDLHTPEGIFKYKIGNIFTVGGRRFKVTKLAKKGDILYINSVNNEIGQFNFQINLVTGEMSPGGYILSAPEATLTREDYADANEAAQILHIPITQARGMIIKTKRERDYPEGMLGGRKNLKKSRKRVKKNTKKKSKRNKVSKKGKSLRKKVKK
tara:strand:- start:1846 stop:2766 length:921 start_codon:yes stop_codon:yes gene_type:complete